MYIVNNDVFIRYEKSIPDNKNVFIFIGSTNDMYEASFEVYEILMYIKKGFSIENIVEEINKEYKESTSMEIMERIDSIINFLLNEKVISKYETS